MIKILSYNINGIRAAIRKGFVEWLEDCNPDIICLQETKANVDQFDQTVFNKIGYNDYWFSAEKKGYSGVGILTKLKPNKIHYGVGIDYMDREGRNLMLDFDNFSVMSLYLPSGTNIDRLGFKFKYMDDFFSHVDKIKKSKKNLIIAGDYNICHEAIDIHDPIRNAKVSGFLPEERQWLDRFLKSGFTDTFRFLNKDPHQYSWWSYRANSRVNNKGWRIDYLLSSENLNKHIKKSYIMNDIHHSDHCPIGVNIEL